MNDEGKGRIRQFVANALDKALHGRRLRIVGAARDILMQPDEDTDIVGMPLPINPEAVAALKERVAQGRTGARSPLTALIDLAVAKPICFLCARLTRGALAGVRRRSLSLPCTGKDADLLLNWGSEGQEGPVLATGEHHPLSVAPHTAFCYPRAISTEVTSSAV